MSQKRAKFEPKIIWNINIYKPGFDSNLARFWLKFFYKKRYKKEGSPLI